VQGAPIKPTVKAPGTERLNLQYDTLLSSVAFKFNLRRFTQAAHARACHSQVLSEVVIALATLAQDKAWRWLGH